MTEVNLTTLGQELKFELPEQVLPSWLAKLLSRAMCWANGDPTRERGPLLVNSFLLSNCPSMQRFRLGIRRCMKEKHMSEEDVAASCLFGWHGSREVNHHWNILHEGFDPRKRIGQSQGVGEYHTSLWIDCHHDCHLSILSAIIPSSYVFLSRERNFVVNNEMWRNDKPTQAAFNLPLLLWSSHANGSLSMPWEVCNCPKKQGEEQEALVWTNNPSGWWRGERGSESVIEARSTLGEWYGRSRSRSRSHDRRKKNYRSVSRSISRNSSASRSRSREKWRDRRNDRNKRMRSRSRSFS